MEAARFYGSSANEKDINEVYEKRKRTFVGWIKTSKPYPTVQDSCPRRNITVFQEFLDDTTAQIQVHMGHCSSRSPSASSSKFSASTNVSTADSSTSSSSPVPENNRTSDVSHPNDPETLTTPPYHLTVDEAYKILNSKRFTNAVNIAAHEYTLHGIYLALVFLKSSMMVLEDDKPIWTTVALKMTGKTTAPEVLRFVLVQISKDYAKDYIDKMRCENYEKGIKQGILANLKDIQRLTDTCDHLFWISTGVPASILFLAGCLFPYTARRWVGLHRP